MIQDGRAEHNGNGVTPQAFPVPKGGTVPPFPLRRGVTRSEVARGGEILHRWAMMFDPGPMRRPNPLPPDQMTDAERRAELCGLLALGLMRLKMKDDPEPVDDTREILLHYPPDQCRHATPTQRRNP